MGVSNQTQVKPVPAAAVLDPDDAERVLTTLYGFVSLSGWIIAIDALVQANHRVAILAGTGAIVFGFLLLLARSKRTIAAGALGSGFLLGIVVVSMVTGFGVRDLSVPIFGFVMLLCNLVLDEVYARFATILTWSVAVSVALAEYLGLFVTPFSAQTGISSVVIMGSVHLALAFTARHLVRAFHHGLRRAYVQELSYRHIFNATTEAIMLIDPHTQGILDVNQSAQTMFGYSRREFLSASFQDLVGRHLTQDESQALLDSSLRGEHQLFVISVLGADEIEHTVEVSLRATVIGTQDVLLAVARDASEARRIQAKLQESEKLQAVGQLAGGIAHDFNNQLTGILANASILQAKLTDPRLQKCADVIVRCSRRSSDLTSQLLAFARRGKHQDVTVDIHELIGEVVELLKHTIDKRIVLRTELVAEDLYVRGDPTLLQNALLNLGLNACDAMPQGGTLSFVTSVRHLEHTMVGPQRSLPNGPYAQVVVQDTGSGMDDDTMRRAFEPFFTTKATGNGMGLAAVYGAVESHRGDISIESELGQGTRFTILLPISELPRESVTVKVLSPLMKFDGIRVLLAEDEDDVAHSTGAILEELGCDVVRCRDGLEAVELYRADPSAFDVALVDHMMPRLSGREALEQMRAVNPDLRALITSGYSNEAVVERSTDHEYFLPKPFNQAQLSLALARVLDSAKKSSETTASS